MTQCLLCGFPHLQTELPCAVCGCEEHFIVSEDAPADLACRLAGQGGLAECYAALEDLVARGEADAEDCLRLAWLSLAFEDARAVETWSHEAGRLDPAWAEPHLALAWALEKAGRWQEAVEEYEAALRRGVAGPGREAWAARRRDAALARIPEW